MGSSYQAALKKGDRMPTVNDILRQKHGELITIDPYATVLEAVQKMNRNRVGAALVTDDDSNLVGIFTERDVLARVVANELNPREALVHEVMTEDVLYCGTETDLDDVAEVMKIRRIRHLPVRDEHDRLVGMISIGDINAYNVAAKQATIDNMTDYIWGRG
jgi:CBS domain-containing protein